MPLPFPHDSISFRISYDSMMVRLIRAKMKQQVITQIDDFVQHNRSKVDSLIAWENRQQAQGTLRDDGGSSGDTDWEWHEPWEKKPRALIGSPTFSGTDSQGKLYTMTVSDGENNIASIGKSSGATAFIPVYGDGRDAIDAFQHGQYIRSAVNTALAISDLILVRSIYNTMSRLVIEEGIVAGTKRYFGIGVRGPRSGPRWANEPFSHSFEPAKNRLRSLGFDMSGHQHHWLIQQDVMRRNPWLKPIGNQHWNFSKFENKIIHRRWGHGQSFINSGGKGKIIGWQLWYPFSSTPNWFKFGLLPQTLRLYPNDDL